jgi:hypothetical protein
MIILGLLLLAAAAVAAVELIVANDNAQLTVHMWRWSWTVDAFWLAVAGAAILAAALLGLFLLKAGGKRERRMRRERRQLAKENRQLAERAEIAEATEPESEPVRDAAPQAYPAPAETTSTPPPAEPRRQYAAPEERSTAPEERYTAPGERYTAPGEQAYAGEPVEGRRVDG